jgi:hypothetical protein
MDHPFPIDGVANGDVLPLSWRAIMEKTSKRLPTNDAPQIVGTGQNDVIFSMKNPLADFVYRIV